jgi:hypothetical protein
MDTSNGSLLPEISATKAVAVVAVAATVGFAVGGRPVEPQPEAATAAVTADGPLDRAEARLRKKLKPSAPAASQAATD